ncbi:MAG: cytochrome c biogenesis protein ResB [Gammaproteobacteria bacterium]|nr:cytochrome c biogenesis protein ResB [Gammaproteobacteria bacterium]
MSSEQVKQRNRNSIGRILLEFLGSMNLAITLLVAIIVAAIIGTVLQQNQAYTGYLAKFGPFWFEFFEALGLYDIYGTTWFWSILAFLLISTSVCIYRNAPGMLREMRQFRLDVQEKSLRSFHNVREWRFDGDGERQLQAVQGYLKHEGYAHRIKDHGDHRLLAARKGTYNRIGYLLTHLSIIVTCVGAVIDANLPLKIQLLSGAKQVETRDIIASEVPEKSVLQADENDAFRGNVYISEGGKARIAFLGIKEGYLVQHLPFTIELKDFRIEHYLTGQPKSFESDLVIHDTELAQPLEKTISVNHPLVYRGYSIYQADFRDGGSKLTLHSWGVLDGEKNELKGEINQSYDLGTPLGKYILELNDFRKFNIDAAPEGHPSGKEKINYGPSFTFKLRNEAGEALEYTNYMLPVLFDGRNFFLSGVRKEVGEPMQYIHFPADENNSMQRFMQLRAALADKARVSRIVDAQMRVMASRVKLDDATRIKATTSIVTGVERFVQGGYDAILAGVDREDPDQQNQAKALLNVMVQVFKSVYLDVMKETGRDTEAKLNEKDILFFDDALNVMASIHLYGSPIYMQLSDFEHVQASGLQIAKAPGTMIFYLGCLMLILGVFFMFYIHHRRLWVWVKQENGQTIMLFAGSGDRDQRGFAAHFKQLADTLEQSLQPNKA